MTEKEFLKLCKQEDLTSFRLLQVFITTPLFNLVNGQDDTGKTPLMILIQRNHEGTATLLNNARPDLALTDNDDNTALSIAIETYASGGSDYVTRLLEYNSNEGNSYLLRGDDKSKSNICKITDQSKKEFLLDLFEQYGDPLDCTTGGSKRIKRRKSKKKRRKTKRTRHVYKI